MPTEVHENEIRLARQLIEQQATDAFNPTLYSDEVHARVEAAIQKKIEGKQISLAEAPKVTANNVIDLTAALKASLSSRADSGADSKLGPRKSPKRAERKVSARRSSRA